MQTIRFLAGATIVLVVIVTELGVAFVASGSTTAPQLLQCPPDGNLTACQNLSKTDFLTVLFHTSISGFDDAPLIFNAIWLLVMGGLLTIGIILIVISFIPTVSA